MVWRYLGIEKCAVIDLEKERKMRDDADFLEVEIIQQYEKWMKKERRTRLRKDDAEGREVGNENWIRKEHNHKMGNTLAPVDLQVGRSGPSFKTPTRELGTRSGFSVLLFLYSVLASPYSQHSLTVRERLTVSRVYCVALREGR
jgi:hypothetical protein